MADVKITYFTEVTSSWCYWFEPAWAELQARFKDQVSFDWKIALLDAAALPTNREQLEWFYRRSGTITRSPFMLNSGWYDPALNEYLAPNCIAEAAKDLGINGDAVRLEIARAGLREGEKIGEWKVSLLAALRAASNLDCDRLNSLAKSEVIEARIRASTAEFHALKMTQRPAFLIENRIGDRAAISGVIEVEAIAAMIKAMLADATAYASHAAHFGSPPP